MLAKRPVPSRTGAKAAIMSTPSGSRLRVALIGAGVVGTAVTEVLRRAGHEVTGVSSRRAESAERSAARLETRTFDHKSELPPADVLLLGVPDEAIGPVVSEVGRPLAPGAVVVHFAGALGIEPLAEASAAGAGVAALHPVQTFPDVERGIERLPGSAWGVTASPEIEPWASGLIAADLGGLPVIVPEEARPVWHAAAASTSNGIAALLAAGEAMLAAIGIDEPHRVLGPLAAGTVANASERGAAESLTGPVVRSETTSIARHLDALTDASPQLAEDYARISGVIVDAAMRAHRIEKDKAEKMLELLENRPR
ncbi:MAG: DUF2520 domain-containing protein [Actinobacteria bacterium]|nr:DUF2520 domain-containing protein [Actinomycetota bacterium]